MPGIDPNLIVECSANAVCAVSHAAIFSVLIFAVLMLGFAYATLLERRLVAWFQHRVGPNRTGPKGIFQPIADGVKLAFKEDVTPTNADKFVYWLAPALKAIPILLVVVVIPFGPPLLVWIGGVWYRIPLGLADVNVGVLWLLAITSVGTYGVVLSGWGSGSKYSMMGGLRASAQMISYELSMGLSMVVPIMIAGSMSMRDIIDAQAVPAMGLGWFVFQNPLAAAILLVALLAEVGRSPFDMPEAESELVGGYNTEYSGMKFALLFAGEYVGMIAVSTIAASMYFGGYHWPLPWVNEVPLLGPVNLVIKIVFFISMMLWVRATLPRFRYDRLMAFGWKVMLPLALVAVAWTAITLVVSDQTDDPNTYMILAGIVFGLVALVVGFITAARSVRQPRPADLTDSRSGLGWTLVQLIGALLAPPVLLFNYAVKYLGNLFGFVRDLFRRDKQGSAEGGPELVAAAVGVEGGADVTQVSATTEPAVESESAPEPPAAPAEAAPGSRGPKIVRRNKPAESSDGPSEDD